MRLAHVVISAFPGYVSRSINLISKEETSCIYCMVLAFKSLHTFLAYTRSEERAEILANAAENGIFIEIISGTDKTKRTYRISNFIDMQML